MYLKRFVLITTLHTLISILLTYAFIVAAILSLRICLAYKMSVLKIIIIKLQCFDRQ